MNTAEHGMAAYLGKERLAYLQQLVVGVAGAGGLGSNCAMALARCGFKRFVLADFDRVEASNLNRQAFRLTQVGQHKVVALSENMLAVNPDIEIDIFEETLTAATMPEIFASCDVVIEAFDQPFIKKKLVEVFMDTDKLVVTASGIGGTGDADAITTRKVRENLYMIGDMQTECSMDNPPFAPKVMVAAAKQADVVLSYFLNKFNEQEGA